MKHPAMRIAAVLLLLAAGCRGSDRLTAPDRALPTGPSSDMEGMDCELNPLQCQAIQRGINQLIAHPNPQCVSLGAQAQVRYDAPSGEEGFRPEPQVQNPQGIDDEMGVYVPFRDGYTNVYPAFWTSPYVNSDLSNGALIAHEEVHQNGGNEDQALAAQAACLNWQA